MNKTLKIFRAVIVSLLVLLVAVPVAFYVILSTEWAQNRLRVFGEDALGKILGTEVLIQSMEIRPFGMIDIKGVVIKDDFGQTALTAGYIGAGVELPHFIKTGRLIVDYIRVDNLHARLYKDSPGAPLNVAGILSRLKSDNGKSSHEIDLRINRIAVHGSSLTYDVNSMPSADSVLDMNHAEIRNIEMDVCIPEISKGRYEVSLDHLSFEDRSGLFVKDITGNLDMCDNSVSINGLSLVLKNSEIKFTPIRMDMDGWDDIAKTGVTRPVSVGIGEGSHIFVSDLSPLFPAVSGMDVDLDVVAQLDGTIDRLNISRLAVDGDGLFEAIMSGHIGNLTSPRDLEYSVHNFVFESDGKNMSSLLSSFYPNLSSNVIGILRREGAIKACVSAEGSIGAGTVGMRLIMPGGAVDSDLDFTFDPDNVTASVIGDVVFRRLNMGILTGNDDFGLTDGRISIDVDVCDKTVTGNGHLSVDSIDFKGYRYADIEMIAESGRDSASLRLKSDDPNLRLTMAADAVRKDGVCSWRMRGAISDTDLSTLGIYDRFPGHKLSVKIDGDAYGMSVDDMDALVSLSDISYCDDSDTGLHISKFEVDMDNHNPHGHINVTSDFLNGELSGRYSLTTLVPTFKDIVSHVFPAYADDEAHDALARRPVGNCFIYDFTLSNAENISNFFNLPVQVIYPVSISGSVDYGKHSADLSVDAPYLQQGDKIIENTAFHADIKGLEETATVYAATQFPTKKGPMSLVVNMNGGKDRIDTGIDWVIERSIPLNGSIGFSTIIDRDEKGALMAEVNFEPGEINFGENLWDIRPSCISYHDKELKVDHFSMSAGSQSIGIHGLVSEDPEDRLVVDLDNINLDYIFETLEIDKALIGGDATGTFNARCLFTDAPRIYCDDLHVDNIGYNHCVLGDADISAYYDNDKRSFYLDADVVEPEGRHSRIYGDIYPFSESLDMNFEANHVKVGFMKPFMQAFASDIRGYVSGKARLFGTFKYIDMEGDVFADGLKLKIDFTNTWYSATDSIHITPGSIDVRDITIHDAYGNSAKLNGVVKHTFFKAPEFDFKVSDAENFLSYDVTSRQSPDWYGRIFGNGYAHIKGEPGVVDISVNMSTAPQSVFTFVLSDREDSSEYSFITFRDRGDKETRDSLVDIDDIPLVVKEYQARMAAKAEDKPSAYNMDIQVDITPSAQMILVMDPVGGDEIKATGKGNIRMTYGSANNDLKMYGTYTLDKGSYNFTLQDIIIKDFTIKEGSKISFHGDPYAAQLGIEAVYSLNANLSDLDESFLQDKDLNRTNVPVHALLKVAGDMRQPDISFDLEFPTLTQDTYRKVRSIVSTEEMMNRQIIYLLALNRFYTPDYMASTTKGNELFSVASSTISSQLSSMLGKLSENWSIAPNLRSDRGDFSDVEVDLTLSSNLLNNRLLFNGNFGYRDKSLNTNQFIGDFDIEYLLNKRGSWRLKAYNRYNDQNYYVRTAQTTQGIGIMYRRDFDRMFNFLRRRNDSVADDSLQPYDRPVETADSVPSAAE